MTSIRTRIFNGRPSPSAHDDLELARIGTCQPHGAILVVDRATGCVEHVSANCRAMLGLEPDDILGRRASDVVTEPESVSMLEDILKPAREYFENPQRITAHDTEFEVVCHVRGRHLFIELEPWVEAEHDYAVMVDRALDTMSRQTTRSGLYSAAVDLMQYVTGWDRVLLYRFVAHGHGVVVAERRGPDSKLPYSFLNHHFSAADIPENAKEILRTGKTRQKPTQGASVLLLTRGPDGAEAPSGDAVDLTDCWLRGIHSCDNGYNTNLGVGSNIVFPVMMDSELWGLFVVHNKDEKFLNYDSRAVIEQITMMFIARLLEIEEIEGRIKERYDLGNALLKAIEEAESFLTAPPASSGRMRDVMVQSMRRGTLSLTPSCPGVEPVETSGRRATDSFAMDLLALVQADGAAIYRPSLNGHVQLVDKTPDALEVRGIASLFGAGLPAFPDGEWRVFATDALGDYTALPDSVLSRAAGLLAAPIGSAGDMILWFREEEVQDVTWAGRPWSKKDLSSERMFRSRDDFTSTRGQLSGASRPWLDAEVVIAARFCASLGTTWDRLAAARASAAADRDSLGGLHGGRPAGVRASVYNAFG